MFDAKCYRIIETKEEFLEDWNSTFKRYDHAVMPTNFSIDKATFPMALKYCSSWDSHCCGSWFFVSIEEARENILKIYQDRISYLLQQQAKLIKFSS